MNYTEKRAALKAHPTELLRWKILLVALSLNVLLAVYFIIGDIVYWSNDLLDLTFFTVSVLSLALNAWVWWGTYRLERWVTIMFWINLVLAFLAGFNIIAMSIFAIGIWIYNGALNIVYPKKPTV